MRKVIFLLCIFNIHYAFCNTNSASQAPQITNQGNVSNSSELLTECAEAIIAKYGLFNAIGKGAEMLQSNNSNFQVLGDVILTKAASFIEKDIKNGALNIDNPETQKILDILASNNCFIRIDMPVRQKIWLNLKKGNFGYLFGRLENRLKPFLHLLLTILSLFTLTVLCFLIFRIIRIYKLKPSNMRKFTAFLFFVTLFISCIKAQSLSESVYKSVWNNEVQVNTLKSNGTNIGQSIYLSRSSKKVKAMYFASASGCSSVYERYNNWRFDKKVIACFAGAYLSGNYSSPLGLTIDSGRLVNRNVDQTMDGLVIVEAIGGVRISDLDQTNCIYLQSLKQYVNPRDAIQKQQFVNWAANEDATVFQTNLLYFKNLPKMGNVPASAERRILALIEKNGIVTHSIFNIEQSVSLTDVAKEIFFLLHSSGFSVIAMINLDTGMCNAFELYDSNGRQLPFHGSAEMKSLSNMIVYYYDNK